MLKIDSLKNVKVYEDSPSTKRKSTRRKITAFVDVKEKHRPRVKYDPSFHFDQQ